MSESESTPTEEESPDPAGLRKRGDEAVAKAEELEGQVAALQKELAFTNAGIPTTGTGALLRKAYEGDLTSEAIAAAAEEYGVAIGQAQEAPPAGTAAPEPEVAAALGAASQGLVAQPAAAPDEQGAIIRRMQELNREGGNDALLRFLDEQGMLSDPERSAEEVRSRLGL